MSTQNRRVRLQGTLHQCPECETRYLAENGFLAAQPLPTSRPPRPSTPPTKPPPPSDRELWFDLLATGSDTGSLAGTHWVHIPAVNDR